MILEAAETGKMNMPSGEYLRMANEAKALWDQAQDLKGIQCIEVIQICFHTIYNIIVLSIGVPAAELAGKGKLKIEN